LLRVLRSPFLEKLVLIEESFPFQLFISRIAFRQTDMAVIDSFKANATSVDVPPFPFMS